MPGILPLVLAQCWWYLPKGALLVSIVPLESPGLMGMLRAVQFLVGLLLSLKVCSMSWQLLVSGRASPLLTACLAASVQLSVRAQGLSLLHFMGNKL